MFRNGKNVEVMCRDPVLCYCYFVGQRHFVVIGRSYRLIAYFYPTSLSYDPLAGERVWEPVISGYQTLLPASQAGRRAKLTSPFEFVRWEVNLEANLHLLM